MTLPELLLSGGASVALIGILGKYLEFRWTNKSKKSNTTTTINAIAKIYQAMSSVIAETSVERFIVFKVENGGGIPRVGANIYISALMELHEDPNHSIFDNYQRIRADASYITMLAHILSNGNKKFVVSEMEDSLLKSIYLTEKIKYSEVYHLHTTDAAIYYCSLATTQDSRYEKPHEQLRIRLAVGEISELLKKNV